MGKFVHCSLGGFQTCDSEDSGGVAQRDELVFAPAVVDDQLHVVGAQSHAVRPDGEGRGRTVRHLPVATFQITQTHQHHSLKGSRVTLHSHILRIYEQQTEEGRQKICL